MDRYENLLTVGRKKGDWDFSVRATIQELSYEEMKDFRSMVIVAIGTMEDMWRRQVEKDNPAVSLNGS